MGFKYSVDFKQYLSTSLLPYGEGMLKSFREETTGIPFTLKKGDVLTFVDNSGLAVLMFQLIEDRVTFSPNMLMGYIPGSVAFRDHKKHAVMPVLKMAKCRLPMEVEMEWYFKQNIV